MLEKRANSLMLPSTVFWWLKGYEAVVQHLNEHSRHACSDEHCIISRLDQSEADSAWAG
jgi:hypothetical protein